MANPIVHTPKFVFLSKEDRSEVSRVVANIEDAICNPKSSDDINKDNHTLHVSIGFALSEAANDCLQDFYIKEKGWQALTYTKLKMQHIITLHA